MEANKKQVNEKMSIDLGRALQALLKNGLMISLVAVLCAVVAYVGTFLFVTPKWTGRRTKY